LAYNDDEYEDKEVDEKVHSVFEVCGGEDV
jgi:hypothetical protein